ncbi:MAG: hypothetical protein ACREAU_00705 [Nitrosopumilaceae archaeon]
MPTIQELRSAFKKPDSTFVSNYYPFWEMEVGKQARIRFLPDTNQDNPHGFLFEKLTHNLVISGEKKVVPCLKMYGDECPICKHSGSYYKAGDKETGKKFWRTKQHIAQILVLKDPTPIKEETGTNHEGEYRLLGVSYQLYNIIKEAFEGGELEELPYAYKGGYDFIIKKSMLGEYANYTVGTKFANKPSDLDDEEVAVAMANIVDLSTLIPAHPGKEKVEAMLREAFTGATVEHDEDSSPLAAVVGASTSAVSTPEDTAADANTTSEADDILAKIRARRNISKTT